MSRERFRATKVIMRSKSGKGKVPGRGTDVATNPPGGVMASRRAIPSDRRAATARAASGLASVPSSARHRRSRYRRGWCHTRSAATTSTRFSGGPQGPQGPAGGINIPPQNENRFVSNEVMLEFIGNLPATTINALATRNRLQQIEAFTYTLTNTTLFRARITDGRDVRTVLRGLGREGAVLRSAQPNYLYTLGQAEPATQAEPAPQATPPANPETDAPAADARRRRGGRDARARRRSRAIHADQAARRRGA